MAITYETTTLLIDRLQIEDVAEYQTVARLVIPQVSAGDTVIIYGESHGDPRQPKRVKECAWVTGIRINGADSCRPRGRDLYRAQKAADCRFGQWTAPTDMSDVEISYAMRAINLKAGGEFRVSWVKLGAIVL